MENNVKTETVYKDYPFFTRLFGHFKTITTHKLKVQKLCFKIGLYKQGLLHDLSKYSFLEFFSGVKYFQGDRSPIDRERHDLGYSAAWLHHKGRNRHHWEYWLVGAGGQVRMIEMPKNYVKEMACDRVAACMIYQKDKYTDASALAFLTNSKEKENFHPNTLALITKYLTWIKDDGLEVGLNKIKED